MNDTRRPWLTLRVKSPFWRQVLLSAGVQNGSPASFPGTPGSRWRDADGDMWVLADDGKLRMTNRSTTPDDVKRLYGPMTRVGGESQ